MQPLKITACMGSPIAVYDDYSPSLDALLEWLILDSRGLAVPNPTAADVDATRGIVDAAMPIVKGDIAGEWYWQVSGPCYLYSTEQTDKFRKRWDPGIGTPEPDWGKRKPTWNTSMGAEKAYELPLYLRDPEVICWYAVGDPDRVLELVRNCTGLGKKRAIGFGQITRWQVEEIKHDYHLFQNGILMRPVPYEHLSTVCDFGIRDWGWRPPTWLPANKRRCAMPVHTVRLG